MPSPTAGHDANRPSLERDGVVLSLFLIMLVMLVAGTLGAHRVFGYALVAFIGVLVGVGFVRRHDRLTWAVPLLAVAFLLVGLIGVFATEDRTVDGTDDTILGFHPATAFLVYVIWIPAYFTIGVSFTILFDRLGPGRVPLPGRAPRRSRREEGDT